MSYPCIKRHRQSGVIVLFDSERSGSVLAEGHYSGLHAVGTYSHSWFKSESDGWEPCADPRQTKKQKLMAMLKDFR